MMLFYAGFMKVNNNENDITLLPKLELKWKKTKNKIPDIKWKIWP